MPKFFIVIATLFLLFITATSAVNAASLGLTYIGNLAVDGKQYNKWWYSSPNPTLRGIAIPGEQVAVTIDGVKQHTTVDTSGNWSYASSMAEGTHKVTVASSTNSINFDLNIGSDIPEDFDTTTSSDEDTVSSSGTKGGKELPVAGSPLQTILLLSFGFTALITGIKLKTNQ